MSWLIPLRDQLPLLLVLSPVVGFLITMAAVKTERDLTRTLGLSNALCTLLLVGIIIAQFELRLRQDQANLKLTIEEFLAKGHPSEALEVIHEKLAQRRAQRLQNQLFSIDGLNLWPVLLLVVVTALVLWQIRPSVGTGNLIPTLDRNGWFIPQVLLFESLALAALTAQDLRIFIISSALAAVSMTVLIGYWGGSDRRPLAERFLFTQICGGGLVTVGFPMLIVSIPWMKVEDSGGSPNLIWDAASIASEIQYWTTRFDFALHYATEVFPWMLLLLSIGFAIQAGLFPVHSWLVELLRETPGGVAALAIAGTWSIGCVSWFRFVLPLAPDLLVGMDRLILVPAVGGAIWGAIRALEPGPPRQQAAWLFVSITGLSLLGGYSLTRFGVAASWLLQQQLVTTFCAGLLAIDFIPPQPASQGASSSDRSWQMNGPRTDASRLTKSLFSMLTTRTLLLLLALPALGFAASEYVIMSELLRDNLWLELAFMVGGALTVWTVSRWVIQHASSRPREFASAPPSTPIPRHLWVALALVAFVNLAPMLMFHQCEPDLARVFQRFERPATEPDAANRQ